MTQKQRSLVSLAVILALAGGLGATAYVTTQHDEQKKKADEKAAQLFSFDKGAVTALAVEAKGEKTELAKADTDWKLTAPVAAMADGNTVDSILANLSSMKKKSTVEEHATDLAKYGLDKPSATLTATYPGGTAEIALGSFNQFSNGQYAKLGGSDAVVLVEGNHDAVLARTTFDLRDKRLAVFDEGHVSKIEVNAGKDVYTIARDGKGWQVTAPKEEPADSDAVNKIMNVASTLRATSIAAEKDPDPAKFGLDAPTSSFAFTMDDGKRIEVKFGTAKPSGEERTYAQASTGPLVAQVPSASDSGLHQSLEQLEDKTVARVDRNAVAAMTFTTAKGEKILLKKPKGQPDGGGELWTVLSPHAGIAKRWKVNSLLYLFSNLKGTQVVGKAPADLAKFGLDKPTHTATLQDNAGTALADLVFGKEDGANTYVVNGSDPRIFEIAKSRLSELPTSGEDIVDMPKDVTKTASK